MAGNDCEEVLAGSSQSAMSNPLFLHHSDNSGLVLVSKPLTGDNYSSWQRSMSKALNAIGFVNGTITPPSQTDNRDDFASWSRCNDMVHSWIVNSLSADLSDSVMFYSTAREVWEDLQERFSQSNAPRIYEIQRDLSSLRQDQLSVAAYYTKIKVIWDELSTYDETCQCGVKLEQQRLMQFLMGLNESYSVVRGQVLLMNHLPTVRQAYHSICQEEKQRGLAVATPQNLDHSSAMAVRNNNNDRGIQNRDRNTRQNFHGYRFGYGSRRYVSLGRQPHCIHCDSLGHFIETCYKLHGFPHRHPKDQQHQFKNSGGRRNISASSALKNTTTDNNVQGNSGPSISGFSDSQVNNF